LNLVLIEDDLTIARELCLRWGSRGWEVRVYGRLACADAAACEVGADLIVLDLQLPDGDGLPWLERLRRRGCRTPVLVLTAKAHVADRVAGLRRGADDYLVKPFVPEELDARVEALLRRSGAPTERTAKAGPLMLELDGRAFLYGAAIELFPREFQVLSLLVKRSPRLVPKRLLVEALASTNFKVGDSAVEVYVSRLRRKLVGSGVVILTLRGFGYRLVVQDTTDAGGTSQS